MSLRCRELIGIFVCAFALRAAAAEPLRVCADPDNLPYSHENLHGFENRIAEVIAAELQRPLAYHWLPQRRGFVRKTIGERLCDVWIGVPVDFERVLTTRPYYRSSYVFVTRAESRTPLRSFEDSRLPELRIGVQLIGNDLATTPPGYALARRGAVAHVVGFTVDGDGPAAQRIVQSLAEGQLDAALVWGPQVSWFAKNSSVPLDVTPAKPPPDMQLPFEFEIAMGVRRGDRELRDQLQSAIDQRRADIDAILASYSVPRTDRAMR
jgi:mxaJ protein